MRAFSVFVKAVPATNTIQFHLVGVKYFCVYPHHPPAPPSRSVTSVLWRFTRDETSLCLNLCRVTTTELLQYHVIEIYIIQYCNKLLTKMDFLTK